MQYVVRVILPITMGHLLVSLLMGMKGTSEECTFSSSVEIFACGFDHESP